MLGDEILVLKMLWLGFLPWARSWTTRSPDFVATWLLSTEVSVTAQPGAGLVHNVKLMERPQDSTELLQGPPNA